MEQTTKKKSASFLVTVLIAGTMYTLYSVQGPFYVQFKEFLGYTHTQLGVMTSVAGWVTQFGFIISIWLTDRFSKRRLMSIALVLNGLTGFILSTFPSYPVMILLFCLFAVYTDMMCWPTILKTVRLIGDSNSQGRLFGVLEMGRGLCETLVNFAALGILVLLGSSLLGLKGVIWFYSIVSIILAYFAWKYIEDDEIAKFPGSFKEKNKKTLEGIKIVLKNKGVWLVASNVFLIYCVYCGMRYFTPFLTDIYALPVSLASAYTIINTMGLKMLGGPIAGFCADKWTHSSTNFIRISLGILTALLAILIAFPNGKGGGGLYIVMIWILVVDLFIFCTRSIYFAPMDEMNVPREYTGAAMSLGSFIGYMPGAFMRIIYGNILDTHTGIEGYRMVFAIMMCCAAAGVLLSSFLVRKIKKQKGTNV